MEDALAAAEALEAYRARETIPWEKVKAELQASELYDGANLEKELVKKAQISRPVQLKRQEVTKMVFDANSFAEELKNTIDWIYSEGVSLQGFKENKYGFNKDKDYIPAFRTLVELLITQSWYYSKPKDFDWEMDSFLAKHGAGFRTPEAQSDLVDLVGELAPPHIANKAKQKIITFLTKYDSTRHFAEELYDLAQAGKTDIVGEKGRDDYLRDFGYWDRIPIDRHEIRFQLRTGIFHVSSRTGKLKKSSFHDTLTHFCSTYLSGKAVEEIDLGNAPGIVDIFIWSYCASAKSTDPNAKTFNICGSTPKCHKCSLKSVCLYAMISASR